MPDEWMLYWVGSPDARAPSPPGRAVWPDLEEREARLGFRDRQPILVDPDYRVDPRLSEFFRRSRFATRAPGTQESYALDYRLLFTFLWRQGRYWDQARPEDLEDYEYWRRKDQRNPVRVGGAKWARELAAFRLLYARAATGTRPARRTWRTTSTGAARTSGIPFVWAARSGLGSWPRSGCCIPGPRGTGMSRAARWWCTPTSGGTAGRWRSLSWHPGMCAAPT